MGTRLISMSMSGGISRPSLRSLNNSTHIWWQAQFFTPMGKDIRGESVDKNTVSTILMFVLSRNNLLLFYIMYISAFQHTSLFHIKDFCGSRLFSHCDQPTKIDGRSHEVPACLLPL